MLDLFLCASFWFIDLFWSSINLLEKSFPAFISLPGPCRWLWAFTRDSADLLRHSSQHTCHHRHYTRRQPAAAGHHCGSDRVQEEVEGRRPHPEAFADADGQSGVEGGPGVQRRWVDSKRHFVQPTPPHSWCGCSSDIFHPSQHIWKHFDQSVSLF